MKRTTGFPTVITLLLIAGCSQPPSIVGEPVLQMDPSGRTPLAGLLTLTTDQPTRVTLTISDSENTSTVTPNDAFSTEHEVMVLGLRPGRVSSIDVQIENEHGDTGEPASLSVKTPPLPDYFPPINVVLSRPTRMEPGLTIIPLGRSFSQESDREFGLFVALDAQGEVVWYYEAPHRVDEPRRMPNGNILHRGVRTQMFEIDMLGRRINHWVAAAASKDVPLSATTIDTDSLHHDVLVMPTGNFLALSTEVRHIESYPTNLEDTEAPHAPANVAGDVLIEFRPDGEIVRQWNFFDLLNPMRHGYGATNTGFYKEVYEDVYEEPPYDWTHANGIDYDAENDAAIISMHHHSAILKLDLASGEIDWVLGHPAGWSDDLAAKWLEPKGELDWFWHQHAPELTPNGTLLIYDNGSYGAFPPSPKVMPPDTYSRAVEYSIDEADGTVEQVWSYGGPGEDWFFSGFISEADWMPITGNILVTNGGRVHKEGGGIGIFGNDGRLWINITEVTHTKPAEKVWEIVIDDPTTGWAAYRSERWPSLYR